jgi:hypothetical protein
MICCCSLAQTQACYSCNSRLKPLEMNVPVYQIIERPFIPAFASHDNKNLGNLWATNTSCVTT